MSIDMSIDIGDFDTFTREEYRRANGNSSPVPSQCRECGEPLTSIQIKRGGKFCSSRCGGKYNARVPAKAKTPNSQPEGRDIPAPTVGGSGAAPAAEKRVPVKVGATEGGPPLRAAETPIHSDDHGLIHIAAALVDVLLAIPGTRSVEMWVGPIGPIEVRR